MNHSEVSPRPTEPWTASALTDLRHGCRSLLKNPFFTLVAISSLALAIGINTTIFAAVDVFLIRPLSFPDSDDLVLLFTSNPQQQRARSENSLPDYRDWRDRSGSMELAAYRFDGVDYSGGGVPRRLSAIQASENLLALLRTPPQEGRNFSPEEEAGKGEPVVILSDSFRRLHFGGSAPLGRLIRLDGRPHRIIGVLPPGFQFEAPADVWLPLQVDAQGLRAVSNLQVLGRLKPGWRLDQAAREMAGITRQLALEHPETNAGNSTELVPLQSYWFDEEFRQASLVFSLGVAFVLLIACANVANMMLARTTARHRELAIRRILGAGRLRLFRQHLTESLLLTALAGALGAAVAALGIHWFISLLPPDWPEVGRIDLNARSLAFTTGISLLCGILFGLAPALMGGKLNIPIVLALGSRIDGDRVSGRPRRFLVISEISLALALLVSSALMLQTFRELNRVDLGFQSDHVVTFRVALSSHQYPTDSSLVDFHRRLGAALESLPGVESVGATTHLPTRGAERVRYWVPQDPRSMVSRRVVARKVVSLGYLETLGIGLISGRSFDRTDGPESSPVAVINETLAERHWPGLDPVGETLETAEGAFRIVGVTRKARVFGHENEPQALFYIPFPQSPRRAMSLAIRSHLPLETLAPVIRTQVAGLAAELPVYEVESLEGVLQGWLRSSVIMTKVVGSMASIALFLAIVGVYGVMAYSVSRRTKEMGIRMALGAGRRDILSMVVGQGVFLSLWGILVGTLIALATTRFLAFFLYGVDSFDAGVFLSSSLLLLLAGACASSLPALRAARVDPIHTLRAD